MTGKELAEVLNRTEYRTRHVLVRVSNDWCEVNGVVATGEHRNAITLEARNPALGGGVIVVEPDLETDPQ